MDRYNFLFLIDDQHRYDALGGLADQADLADHIGRIAVTPHLDALSKDGVTYTQAVCNSPSCQPSRSSLMTGFYASQTGILTNGMNWCSQPPLPSIAQLLAAYGYDAARFGKMHLGDENVPETGLGFRIKYAGLKPVSASDGPIDDRHYNYISPRLRKDLIREYQTAGPGGESATGYEGSASAYAGEVHSEFWLAERTAEWISGNNRDTSKPFLCVLSTSRPHPPNIVPSDFADTVRPDDITLPPSWDTPFPESDWDLARARAGKDWMRISAEAYQAGVARYLGNVAYVDACFGIALQALADGGYSDKTLVVFMSDHGDMLGRHSRSFSKYTLLDSSVRVPLILRWPRGRGRRGTFEDAPVELVDIVPTTLDCAGLSNERGLRKFMFPGSSLCALENPGADWRKATFAEYHHKEIKSKKKEMQVTLMVRSKDWKLLRSSCGRSALYNLAEDPEEMVNLFGDQSCRQIGESLNEELLSRTIRISATTPRYSQESVVRFFEGGAEPSEVRARKRTSVASWLTNLRSS